MARLQISPRRVAPYVVSTASGLHILRRMWRLSRMPATDAALHVFLLKHTDVILILGSGPVIIWHLRKLREQGSTLNGSTQHPSDEATGDTADASLISSVAHRLRQVFTSLLLGLGLIKRKANAGKTGEIPRLVRLLDNVVSEGIDAVNVLDPSNSANGRERAYEA
jgi:hypothetical protein